MILTAEVGLPGTSLSLPAGGCCLSELSRCMLAKLLFGKWRLYGIAGCIKGREALLVLGLTVDG